MANYKPTGFPGVYIANGKLYYRIKFPDAHWGFVPSSYVAGQELEAQKALTKVSNAQQAKAEIFGSKKKGPIIVNDYVRVQFYPRRKKSIEDWKSDEKRLNEHVLTVLVSSVDTKVRFGEMVLQDVRTRHIIEVFDAFRAKVQKNGKPYAPKSIWNAYGVVKALFRDAIIDELVLASPCVLTERELGPIEDADPEWRDTALFTRDELELLISSPLIPFDRQLWYALEGIAAMRMGEVCAFRWRHYDISQEPLGRILVARSHEKSHTKTKRTRHMPVHPVLAGMLAEWRLNGWVQMMGRHPQPDDLVLPMSAPRVVSDGFQYPELPEGATMLTTAEAALHAQVTDRRVRMWVTEGRLRADRNAVAVSDLELFLAERKRLNFGRGNRLPLGAMRTESVVGKFIAEDLQRLGLRHRRGHDLRATFITWVLVDGAIEKHVQACTHTPKSRKAFDLYNRIPWSEKCAAIAKFKVRREAQIRGELVELRAAVGAPLRGKPSDILVPACSRDSQTSESVDENQWRRRESNPSLRPSDTPRSAVANLSTASNSNNVADAPTEAATPKRRQRVLTGNMGTQDVTDALRTALTDWLNDTNPDHLRAQLTALLSKLGGGR